MSLAIPSEFVTHVMIGGEWHTVWRASFDVDSYEFTFGDATIHGGGQSGVCASGFSFTCGVGGETMSGPLTAIQAVRWKATP